MQNKPGFQRSFLKTNLYKHVLLILIFMSCAPRTIEKRLQQHAMSNLLFAARSLNKIQRQLEETLDADHCKNYRVTAYREHCLYLSCATASQSSALRRMSPELTTTLQQRFKNLRYLRKIRVRLQPPQFACATSEEVITPRIFSPHHVASLQQASENVSNSELKLALLSLAASSSNT